jgi:hypothetical protein
MGHSHGLINPHRITPDMGVNCISTHRIERDRDSHWGIPLSDLRPTRPGTTTRAQIPWAAARSSARGSMARWRREAAAACQLRHTGSAALTVAVDEETKNHGQGFLRGSSGGAHVRGKAGRP